MSLEDPELMSTLSMRRSMDYKDPSKTKKPNTQLWNSITSMPKHKLEEYIRPKILQRDKEACESIVENIKRDQLISEMKKQWFVEERQYTRDRLMRQKQKNIELEERAGVKKDYLPVGLSLAEEQAKAAVGPIDKVAPSRHASTTVVTPVMLSQENFQPGSYRYSQESPSVLKGEEPSKIGQALRDGSTIDGQP